MKDLRSKLMSTRKVLCTGNPDKPFTIANGVKKVFPDAKFIHKSAGYDLTDISKDSELKDLFKQYNTFINASYIGPNVQTRLLNLCNECVKFCDIFNIGSTHEYDNLGSTAYRDSKLNLRKTSLLLNTYRFKTCHIIVGGIKKNISTEQQNWIDVDEIVQLMCWVTSQRFGVPIISIDQPKQSW